ncbi:MAG: HEAT repeat domain-containing protein [Candidatus Hydrogenedentota bacterium]|jgi:HEAT repeat protein|uniref:HEAT repeat domain-containing protein n=1 Tax=Sumerlaea chitinivorans TaxID=2250252 RepID=A0A2Z4Y6H5_SUMC1|nr:hypothetical protein BRCON_1809 [Candidatus Sumerlaea chitinivorans]MCX7964952.1 HEAT repeat domain-containing protein [Candidatus Sumerlaea chitinivorans]RMH24954.1 MAG: HEAT repeat domain-containing protein [Candidatus Hydrogenedentota bacterium]GIX45501.1 MAG: hypothetical protein KatS3mg130_1909 [Candidatus Sumerlaea sp.]
MSNLNHIIQALDEGRVPQALSLAKALLENSPHAMHEAQELGERLAAVYREELRVEPALRFRESLAPALPDPIANTVLAPLREELELYSAWRQRLDQIANERLVNELLFHVKAGDAKKALESVRALVATATDGAQRRLRARQIGNVLGNIVAGRERVQAFVQQIARVASQVGLDGEDVVELLQEYESAVASSARRELGAAATQRVELTQAVVELSRSLPDRLALHEPSEEDLERFERVVRAIFAVCLTSYQHNRFYEATQLFVEFVPQPQTTKTAALAGVEQRLYATLGRTARLVAARVFARFGTIPRALDSYVAFAKVNVATRLGPAIVEVLGLLRNPRVVPLLAQWLKQQDLNVRYQCIAALGSIGDTSAQKVLLDLLAQATRGRVVTGEQRREAIAVIQALAQASRSLDAERRSNLMGHVIQRLPSQEMEFAIRTALAFLQGPLDGLHPKLLEWAATTATRALWHLERPELAQQAASSPLGFRQPLIDLLARLVPLVLPTIVSVALEQAKSVNGAYLAIAELFTKVPTPEALPLLRQLIFNAVLYDEGAKRSAYQQEMVYDPTSDTLVPLTRDRLLAGLVYAVNKIECEEAQELLSELFEQIRSGKIPQPGRETADILMQAYMARAQKSGSGPFGVFPGAQTTPADSAVEPEPAKALSPEEHAWIHDLEAKYLLASKRRAKKVAAFAGLAKQRTLAALPTIVKHLTDSDPIIANAAFAALTDYAAPPVPPVVRDRLHNELLGALQLGDPKTRTRVAEVLRKLGPTRSPLKEKLENLLQSHSLDRGAKLIVEQLLSPQQPAASPKAPIGEAKPAAPGAPPTEKPAAEEAEEFPYAHFLPKKSGPITELDKKRAYILARQEWIRSGKRGPEPKPPS